MPRDKKDGVTENEPVKYKTDSLLKSKALSGYQRDFARVLLTEPEYTLEEAIKILDNFFGKKEGK